jgi:hypothetical protein
MQKNMVLCYSLVLEAAVLLYTLILLPCSHELSRLSLLIARTYYIRPVISGSFPLVFDFLYHFITYLL